MAEVETTTPQNLSKPGERIDDLQLSNLKILQDPGRFCFGMDAVLLSGFAKIRKGATVMDLCTGTGIVPILLTAKSEAAYLTGMEIQPDSADMARRSVQLNGLGSRVDIVTGDIKEAASIFGAASFDVVTCNPPYMIADHGLKNPDSVMAIARHEVCCTLEDVCGVTEKLLKPGGSLFMVHRPFRLPEIIRTLSGHGLEPKRMRLVYPYCDREPNMVLIQAVKGGRPRMTVDPPLIVYDSPDNYSAEMRRDYGY